MEKYNCLFNSNNNNNHNSKTNQIKSYMHVGVCDIIKRKVDNQSYTCAYSISFQVVIIYCTKAINQQYYGWNVICNYQRIAHNQYR